VGTLRKITRRSFLIGSLAMAGGAAFGVYSYRKPTDNPLDIDLKQGSAAITPYVLIDADGVTLITPRADKGQGAYSIQAHLLAEELDIDPHKVKLSPGRPDAAYYNGHVLEEGAPFASTDSGWLAERVRGSMEIPAKLMGMQMTGGSSTVKDSFIKLRNAGAVARETIKEAAAQQSGVSRSELKTENGQVVLPDGKTIAYTELAATLADIEPVNKVELRPESEWRYIGKDMQRVDILPKSTGTERYGIDRVEEGMVYASVRANPGLGGTVKSFDSKAAEGMQGVLKVVPTKHGVGVIADNTWRAFQAVNAIDIKWNDGPYPASQAEMWGVLEKSLSAEHQDSRNKNDGGIDESLKDGEILEAEYRIPYLAHAPMEPMNAVVKITDDRLDIWTGTQIPRFIQDHAAALTGMDAEQVHVHVESMGGSFGRRLEDEYVMQAIEMAMAVKGTPVKMTWTREEDMLHDFPRPMQMSRARGKVKDGKVDSYDLSIVSASVTGSWMGRLMGPVPGPDPTIVAGAWDQPFAIPNYRVTGYRAPEMVPISSWRSVGASGNGFLHEGFMDELIHKAGADPLKERIRLCNHDISRKVLETVGELSGWDGSKIAENRGRGVAFTISFGVPTAQVVEVTNTEQGIRLDKLFIVVDVGKVLDPINLEAQLSGGAIFGLGHAMNCELTYENFSPQQTNYHQFEGMRLYQTPEVVVKVLENNTKVSGAGEPGVPPAGPALANAIFAATGQRIREMPFNKPIDFV